MTQLTLLLQEKSDWLNHYDPQGAGIFVPSTSPPEVGADVRIDLRIDGGPRLMLRGKVLWRRTEGDDNIPAGVGVGIASSDVEKIHYLNGYVRGGLLDLRELRRLPLRLPVRFEAPGGGRRQGHTRDINEEGIFIFTDEPLAFEARSTVMVSPPSGGNDLVVTAVVTYVMDEEDGGPGMGMKFDFADAEQYAKHVERVKAWEHDLVNGKLPVEVIS